jgi:EAL domain-containing protein (putative c-di-GMP-specific phosphodiesterase class I)
MMAQEICKALEVIPGWVSLNLDAVISTPEALQEILAAVEGVPPCRLVAELTEHESFANVDLSPLTSRGYKLSIDDWGTGWSNFAALIERPVDYLKIDRSITAGIVTSPTHAHVCRLAIKIAHDLGAQVIGEGVETRGQMDWLRSNGCDLAQGWHTGKPMGLG